MAIKRKVKRNEEEMLVLLDDAFENFIDEKDALNKSPATLKSYEESYIRFCNFFGLDEDTKAEEINQQMLYKFSNTLKHDGLSVSSINHYLRDLRAFFYWCMDADRQYIQSFKVVLLAKQEEPPKLFTEAELELLLEKPRNSDKSFTTWRTWAIVNWVLGTGNRASTICNVKIGDIDFKRKEIELSHTKNKKAQIIPLSPSLHTVLKEYIKNFRYNAREDDYLFSNIGDEKLTTNALRQSFTKYCNDRDVEHTSIHGLRHNFAKGWIMNNGNEFKLQKILGHSTLEMTRRYVRLFGEDLKEDFEKFNVLDNMKRKQRRTHFVRRNED